MPNRAMEFHDSTFDGVVRERANVTLRFSAAYIHQSDGKPGRDAGSCWVQEAQLHVGNAQLSGDIPELPCTLWDGDISLGGKSLPMIPIPLEYEGPVEINLEQNGHLRVKGNRVRLELKGKPTYVEEVPGSH